MKKIVKPYTREEWEQLPDVVKHFNPWEEASQPQAITIPDEAKIQEAVKYFTEQR